MGLHEHFDMIFDTASQTSDTDRNQQERTSLIHKTQSRVSGRRADISPERLTKRSTQSYRDRAMSVKIAEKILQNSANRE